MTAPLWPKRHNSCLTCQDFAFQRTDPLHDRFAGMRNGTGSGSCKLRPRCSPPEACRRAWTTWQPRRGRRRHRPPAFPGQESLAEALFEQRIGAMAALAEKAVAEPDSWAGLVSFLEAACTQLATNRGLHEILMYATHGRDQVDSGRNRMAPLVTALVERAKRDGHLRADVQATDMLFIEFMISAAARYAEPVNADIWRRYLVPSPTPRGPSGRPPRHCPSPRCDRMRWSRSCARSRSVRVRPAEPDRCSGTDLASPRASVLTGTSTAGGSVIDL